MPPVVVSCLLLDQCGHEPTAGPRSTAILWEAGLLQWLAL
jgi:hypothetical protein